MFFCSYSVLYCCGPLCLSTSTKIWCGPRTNRFEPTANYICREGYNRFLWLSTVVAKNSSTAPPEHSLPLFSGRMSLAVTGGYWALEGIRQGPASLSGGHGIGYSTLPATLFRQTGMKSNPATLLRGGGHINERLMLPGDQLGGALPAYLVCEMRISIAGCPTLREYTRPDLRAKFSGPVYARVCARENRTVFHRRCFLRSGRRNPHR